MAGERKPKIVIRADWSTVDANLRAQQTAEVRFRLAGTWSSFRIGGNPDQFAVPAPADANNNDGGRPYGPLYLKVGVENMLRLVQAKITTGGLPYTISAVRDLGGYTLQGTGGSYDGQPVVEFDIEGQQALNLYDLRFNLPTPANPTGWQVMSTVDAIQEVRVSAVVTDALIFGSATGRIELTASNGTTGLYAYTWSDGGPATATRAGLRAGVYDCTVTDASGASTVVSRTVGSDPELRVAVAATDDSITLTPSGGVGPYTYAWADGPTTATRTGLTAGTFRCRVTDAHGAVVDVEVTLSAYQFFWSRNAITLPLDAGDAYRADPTTKPNLSFLCQVWLEKEYLSGTFEQVGPQLEQPADAQGRTTFEVQALLDAYLDYHVPAPGQAEVVRAAPLFRRFFLRHAQQYGTTPTPRPSISLERNYVAKGGLSFYESQARTWFSDYQARVKPFLTWEPVTKPVLADQPEYLYYMVQGTPGSFKCKLRVTFDDGSQLDRELSGAEGVRPFEVYCLPVGYQALGLAALASEGQRVVQWQVWVAKGSTVLSETRTYRLDARTYPQRRYLLFATSLGGMATYAALGEAQQDSEVTGSETALSLPASYDPLAGDVAVQARSLRPVLKLAAGKRTQAQLVASQDLLLSRRVLLLGPGRWLAGYVKAKTAPLFDEGKLVQVQELEFILPTEQLYTPHLS